VKLCFFQFPVLMACSGTSTGWWSQARFEWWGPNTPVLVTANLKQTVFFEVTEFPQCCPKIRSIARHLVTMQKTVLCNAERPTWLSSPFYVLCCFSQIQAQWWIVQCFRSKRQIRKHVVDCVCCKVLHICSRTPPRVGWRKNYWPSAGFSGETTEQ